MKRKLVKYEEVFQKNSLSTVVNELVESQDHLSRTLGTGSLVLESFDDNSVIYQRDDGNFIKANYLVEDNAVTFDNLEELVVDQASEDNKRREIVGKMLEAILEDKETDAHILFEKYMKVAASKYRRDGSLLPPEELDEATRVRLYGTRKNKVSVQHGQKSAAKRAAALKGHRNHPNAAKQAGAKRRAHHTNKGRSATKGLHSLAHSISGGSQYDHRRKKKHMNEWITLSNNVFEYADIVEHGYVLQESIVRTDATGDVTGVKIPSSKARNEGKIIKMHYDKMIKQDSPKVMREAGLRLANNPNFAQAVSELKRYNNVSDNEALEETLTQIVKYFPSVLYLTQDELAKSISYALENAGVTNFADAHCGFMAEGILRTAHGLYEDKVQKLFTLSKNELKENEDAFAAYQKVALNYFPTLDEAIQTEQQVFEDLYNAVLDIRKYALDSQNEEVRAEANEFVSELERVLKGEAQGDIDLAVEVASWLHDIAEANLPGASEKWDLPKTPHHTVTGAHPQMAKNATVAGNPGSFPGDWGDSAPQIGSDSNTWNHGDETRHRSWGNKGGKDVWPTLSNPNSMNNDAVWTMPHEKGADKDGDDDWSRYQSGDTWPNLKNPYIPAAQIPLQKVDPGNRV